MKNALAFVGMSVLLVTGCASTAAPAQFQTYLEKSGKCGSDGKEEFVVNRNRTKGYMVTYEEAYRVGGQSGVTQQVTSVEAGGRTSVGCSNSGTIPLTIWTRKIVGEQELKK